jgi:hypothetical protein
MYVLMVERPPRRHIGLANPKTPLKAGTPGQHLHFAVGSVTPPDIPSLVPLDLSGRTGLTRLRLAVRFGVTNHSANVELGPLLDRCSTLGAEVSRVTHPSGIPVFERFFRSVASIKIDKSDVRRFREFVDEQIDDIAIAGRNSAKWNGRDVVVAQDLPITKGIQERMREFDKLEEAEEIRELLRQVMRQPPSDVTFAEDTERLLPELFGGLSIALARSFRVVDPMVSNPSTEHWNRVFTLFRLVF